MLNSNVEYFTLAFDKKWYLACSVWPFLLLSNTRNNSICILRSVSQGCKHRHVCKSEANTSLRSRKYLRCCEFRGSTRVPKFSYCLHANCFNLFKHNKCFPTKKNNAESETWRSFLTWIRLLVNVNNPCRWIALDWIRISVVMLGAQKSIIEILIRKFSFIRLLL